MTVYIDDFVNYRKRIHRAGPYWSHMIADTDEELDQFALSIGLRLDWAQRRGTHLFHYDIGTKSKRDLAIKMGAVEISRDDIARMIEERINRVVSSREVRS